VSEDNGRLPGNDRDELLRLASAMCDGTITPEGLARLETILHRGEAARVSYAIYMRMNAWLLRRFRSRAADPHRGPGAGTPQSGNPAPVLGFLGSAVHGIAEFLSRPIPLSYLIASLFLGSLLALFAVWMVPSVFDRVTPGPPRQTEVFVAQLTGSVAAEWASPGPEYRPGHQLPVGKRLELSSGLVEITYHTGATVVLEGPSTYEIDSANGGFLRAGQLTAKADTEAAKGFTVRTPTATVADLGTEFAVEVAREDQTEVVVFEGAVRLTSQVAGDGAGDARILRAGQAARLDAKSGRFILRDLPPADREQFARQLPDAKHPRQKVLLADDFHRDSVDPDKWLVHTSNPWGKAAVVQEDGQVELANRGMLITKAQYPPEAHGTLRIAGQWTFVTSGEMPNMDIITVTLHSTGEPAGRYGQATGGLAFFCYAGLDFLDIQYLGNGFLIDSVKRTGKLRIRQGETYRFEIIDSKDTVSFRVTNARDSSQTASVAAKVSGSWNHIHVVFHNREYHGGDGFLARLDNVTISATPKPPAGEPPTANTN